MPRVPFVANQLLPLPVPRPQRDDRICRTLKGDSPATLVYLLAQGGCSKGSCGGVARVNSGVW